jgi:hypothetical protein
MMTATPADTLPDQPRPHPISATAANANNTNEGATDMTGNPPSVSR